MDSSSAELNEEATLQFNKEREAIRAACESNYVNGVSMILADKLKKNIDAFKEIIDDQATGRTLLILAAENGHADMLCVILLMLKKLAESQEHQFWTSTYLERQDTYGLTALHWCSLKGYIDCISVVVHLEPSLINSINRCGQTPLTLALTTSRIDTISYLDSLSDNSIPSRRVSMSKPSSISVTFKNLISKQSIIQCYEVLPAYAYLGSLALTMILSFYLQSQMCRVSSGGIDSDCYVELNALSMILQLIVWWLTINVRTVNPGVLSYQQHNQNVSSSSHHSTSSDNLNNIKLQRTYNDALNHILDLSQRNKFTSSRSFCCHRCRCYRPLRCGHSKLHGRCIPKFDHFCNFLWSDIGRDNYVYFYAFLVIMCLLCPIFLFICANHLVYNLDGDFYVKEYSHDIITIIILNTIRGFTVWVFLVWLLCVLLLTFHTRMSMLGMTTKEYLQGAKKFDYLEKEHLYSHCSKTRQVGVLSGYVLNCIDKFFPLPNDECYDKQEMVELMDRAVVRFHDWRKAVSIPSILQKIGWSGKPSEVEEKYTV